MLTQDEIIEMARQAGFEEPRNWTLTSMPWLCESLEVFAKLVDAKATAKEREACAKLMQSMRPDLGEANPYADAIRARGEA